MQHERSPVILTKEWDLTTPQIYAAFVQNETLVSVLFEFWQANPNGGEQLFQKIELKNARVSRVRYYVDGEGDSRRPVKGKEVELEDVSFEFQSIEIENVAGKTVAADSWVSQFV